MSLRLIGALVWLAVPPLVAATLISNFECEKDYCDVASRKCYYEAGSFNHCVYCDPPSPELGRFCVKVLGGYCSWAGTETQCTHKYNGTCSPLKVCGGGLYWGIACSIGDC